VASRHEALAQGGAWDVLYRLIVEFYSSLIYSGILPVRADLQPAERELDAR
jgi:hypothetical protein